MSNRPHRLHDLLKFPFKRGRLLWTDDPGDGALIANQYFMSHLDAKVIRALDGSVEEYDLGSGAVTNVGVQAMAYDYQWSAQLNLSTLGTQNFHATGTGTTTAANTDIQLQTAASPTTATAQSGVQSTVTSTAGSNLWTFKNVATINYTTTLAITEWGLLSAATMTASTGTPFTAGTATTGTVTGTPLTASSATVRGQQQMIFKDTTAGTNFYGLVLSNTTSVVTVPAWYTVGTGAVSGVNPVNADAFVIQPVMWDHKVFSAINVNNGDSIQFTYSLVVQSGG